jgi:hypothetical protein
MNFKSKEALAAYLNKNPGLRCLHLDDLPFSSLPPLPRPLTELRVRNSHMLIEVDLSAQHALHIVEVDNCARLARVKLPSDPNSKLNCLKVARTPSLTSLQQFPSSLEYLFVGPGVGSTKSDGFKMSTGNLLIEILPPEGDTKQSEGSFFHESAAVTSAHRRH